LPANSSVSSLQVSIIILNWNGKRYIDRCLEATAAQTFSDFETILIDNASTDGSVDSLEERWPGVRVVRLPRNLGFAAANNLGARLARGRWLALLNNDAFARPDWLASLVRAAELHPQYSFFASRILQAEPGDRIDGTGDVYHVSGLAWHRDRNRPLDQAQADYDEVFSACAASALYEREAFLSVGGFEENFISHHEDVDLGFRLRLQGHRCLYVSDAVVEHVGSASYGVESDQTVYHVHRNLVWSYVTNMPGILFWKYLLAHLLANGIFLLYYFLRGQGAAIWRAKRDALLGLPFALRKRHEVQISRKVGTIEIDRMINHGWLSPYVLGKRAKQIRRVAGNIGLDRN
jgi:GT2 family glycosyltransferase